MRLLRLLTVLPLGWVVSVAHAESVVSAALPAPPPAPPPAPGAPAAVVVRITDTGAGARPESPRAAPTGQADRVHGDEAPGLVAFTFDDGPAPVTTPLVLRALARYHIPATFFVVNRHLVGRRGVDGLPLLARMLEDGHLVGGHTASHARLGSPPRPVLQRELDDSLQLLSRLAGRPIELFRPPYGVLGKAATRRVAELGLTDVRWSVDPKDFHNKDPEALREHVLADLQAERGGIVLLHDTKHVTAGAVAELFEDLERLNCRRLRNGAQPLLPVSLHYFLRDDGKPRPVPAEVEARTAAYRVYLDEACQERARRRSRVDAARRGARQDQDTAPSRAAERERDDQTGEPPASAPLEGDAAVPGAPESASEHQAQDGDPRPRSRERRRRGRRGHGRDATPAPLAGPADLRGI